MHLKIALTYVIGYVSNTSQNMFRVIFCLFLTVSYSLQIKTELKIEKLLKKEKIAEIEKLRIIQNKNKESSKT